MGLTLEHTTISKILKKFERGGHLHCLACWTSRTNSSASEFPTIVFYDDDDDDDEFGMEDVCMATTKRDISLL